MKSFLNNLFRLSQYNIKIIFGNKFIYFLLSAIGLYVATVIFSLVSNEEFVESTAYNILLIPSVLIVFYPMCFGIQNDQDAKIIEIIFGIPNYRYKVWFFRIFIAYIICFAITLGFSLLTNWLLVDIPVFILTLQVLVPALFIGTLSFMFSTVVKNGNGTAVIIILILLIFWILSGFLDVSKWNIFLNPFALPENMNSLRYFDILRNNRLIMGISSVVFLLLGLYKTQNREKFI